jgi:large subunit ribosomal protein L15
LYETFALDRQLPIKILSDGDAPASLNIQAHRFSKAAKEKIESKGGKTVLLEG